MTGCKGEDCPFYVEFWTDVDKIGAGCSHPNFDEMKHSIKFGICPFMDDVAEHQQKREESRKEWEGQHGRQQP